MKIEEAIEQAMPHKRWRITLQGDWEEGWYATAESWTLVPNDLYSSGTTRTNDAWGEGYGHPTIEEAVAALAERMRQPE